MMKKCAVLFDDTEAGVVEPGQVMVLDQDGRPQPVGKVVGLLCEGPVLTSILVVSH